jgi:hypothetical protein
MVIIDCRKARDAVEAWRRRTKYLKPLKELADANVRQRVTGTVKDAEDDFARVERKTAVDFTAGCGCSLRISREIEPLTINGSLTKKSRPNRRVGPKMPSSRPWAKDFAAITNFTIMRLQRDGHPRSASL